MIAAGFITVNEAAGRAVSLPAGTAYCEATSTSMPWCLSLQLFYVFQEAQQVDAPLVLWLNGCANGTAGMCVG